MSDSILSAENVDKADVVLLSAGFEGTVSSRGGAAQGPKAVIKMLDSKLELFDRTYKQEPCQKIGIFGADLGDMRSFSPEAALEKIEGECQELLGKEKFVFLLGGEHSVSLGLLTALSKKVNPKDVTILDIDAHCDLRDTDSDYSARPSRLGHSCVMRRVHELGYNLVQVGIRTYYIEEYNYFEKHNDTIKIFEWGRPDSALGAIWEVPSIDKILESIKTKYLYVSIDVDGFDPAHMPGTGTPVQGGLEWWYGLELLREAIKSKTLIGADIVEVSPMQESVQTEYGAAQILYSILAHKFRDRLE